MICVECGHVVLDVYKQFSLGNIRLTRCDNCCKFADKYVEFEPMLLILDLILQRSQVYRHVLFNRISFQKRGINRTILKLVPAFIFFDAYLRWSRLRTQYMSSASSSNLLSASIVRPFDRHFVLLSFASGELATYIIAILVATKILLSKSHSSKPVKYNYLIMAVLLSSFGKLFIVSMMIWDYSSVYGYIINLFVLTSNITALRAFLDVSRSRTTLIVAVGFAARLLFQLFYFAFDPSIQLYLL